MPLSKSSQSTVVPATPLLWCACSLQAHRPDLCADWSQTVTGSNSLTRNILSNNLCLGSWSPGPNFPGNTIPRIQFPGEFNPPGLNFPGDSIPLEIQSPGSNFLGNSIPPDRISARTKFPVTGPARFFFFFFQRHPHLLTLWQPFTIHWKGLGTRLSQPTMQQTAHDATNSPRCNTDH